ncbi:hypothetical protein P280DRAFT_156711 [Massarina eburnea CBS 473.64]|uniref:Uncharacterized protein n=1 Tax=Massarina eburnea CBS 473.64 TaxID=1395130 RepID=A0A6A6RPI7_9PLEO|nr:hypothetical protein P280DRAFT_156711 [Massarina eburnea CBS 473.64]
MTSVETREPHIRGRSQRSRSLGARRKWTSLSQSSSQTNTHFRTGIRPISIFILCLIVRLFTLHSSLNTQSSSITFCTTINFALQLFIPFPSIPLHTPQSLLTHLWHLCMKYEQA